MFEDVILNSSKMQVKPLDTIVKSNIRSGYCVNNVTQCVSELILNSLDARSTHIAVRVNLISFRIQVVDDGVGITEANLEHVGKLNYTNKCESIRDFDKIHKLFGIKGEALAAISNNSKLVKITTRPWNTRDSQIYSKTFLKCIQGKQHTIQETEERACGGTTVTIQDFMYNLPVRQKRTKNTEFNDIITNMQKLFILHPHVTFSLRDDSTRKILFNSIVVETAEVALCQQIGNLDEHKVKYYSMARGRTTVKTLIYLELYEDSKWQMFFVNKLPIKSSELTSFVNQILSTSALGYDNKKSKKIRAKTANYLYLFNLICPRSKYQLLNFNEVEFKNINSIFKLIEQQLKKILEKEKLYLQIDKKHTNIDFKVQNRIHLSGFPGALKASAIRGSNQEEENLIINSGLICPQDKLSNANNPNANLCSKNITSKSSSITSVPLSVNKFFLNEEPEMESREQVIIESNYTKRAIEPFETTSTIGRNYVLNKFLNEECNDLKINHSEFGMFNSKERFGGDNWKEHIAFEKERKVHYNTKQNKLQEIGHKHFFTKNYYSKTETVSCFDDKAEQNILCYCEKAPRQKQRAPIEFDIDTSVINHDNENPWENNIMQHNTVTRRHDFDNTFRPMYITHDWNSSFKLPFQNDVPPRQQVIGISNRREILRDLDCQKKCSLDNASIFDLSRDLKMPSLQKKFYHRIPPTNKCNNNLYKKHLLEFDKRDSKTFNLRLNCNHIPLQTFQFEKTICDLDLSLDDNVVIPEKRQKQADFFRIRASEKFTRFKHWNQRDLNGRLKTKTKTITSNTIHVKRKANTLVSSHSKRTIITYISHDRCYKKSHIIGKMNAISNKRSKSADRIKRLLMKSTRRKREIILHVNKAVNTSCIGDSHMSHQYKSIMMVDKSIQCTISNDQFQFDFQETNACNANTLEPAVNINIDGPRSNFDKDAVRDSKETDYNILITEQRNNFNTDNICLISQHLFQQQNDDFVEGTPQDVFTPWTNYKNQSTLTSKHGTHNPKTLVNSQDKVAFEPGDLFDKCKGVHCSASENDATLMFNLSLAVQELTENCENNIFQSPVKFQSNSITPPSKTKKRIFQSDVFDRPFFNTFKTYVSSDWSRKLDNQGGSYYINKRTGNNMSQIPQDEEVFDFLKRPSDLPKGFSQAFKSTPCITEEVSKNMKRDFHAAVCETYENDNLAYIKWKKYYLQSTGYEDFFQNIYKKCFVIEDNGINISNIRISNLSDSVVLTNEMFQQLNVLRQYDCKFIVAIWKPKNMIVIFDQHAVHERIRLEHLIKKYILFDSERTIRISNIVVPSFEFSCNSNVMAFCQNYENVFKKYGLDIICKENNILLVTAVPECVYNKILRESANQDNRLSELIKMLVYEIANTISDAINFNQWIPPLLSNITISEACRGAVMFGDKLSIKECDKFLQELATCNLPFQCAHGRPTCVPLSKLPIHIEVPRINLKKLKYNLNLK